MSRNKGMIMYYKCACKILVSVQQFYQHCSSVSEFKESWSICEYPLHSSLNVGEMCSYDRPLTAADLVNQLKEVGIVISVRKMQLIKL
jgi:hypothetical protein